MVGPQNPLMMNGFGQPVLTPMQLSTLAGMQQVPVLGMNMNMMNLNLGMAGMGMGMGMLSAPQLVIPTHPVQPLVQPLLQPLQQPVMQDSSASSTSSTEGLTPPAGSTGEGSSKGSSACGGENMVTIFDPINKKPYSLRFDPEATSGNEIVPTAGLWLHLSEESGNKRAFLCKKYQARQCRAQAKCNSIHADRKRVAVLRAAHPVDRSMPVELQVHSEVDDETFDVPIERVHRTQGLATLVEAISSSQAQRKKVPGTRPPAGLLCPKYEHQQCSDTCTSIHVDVAYLRHVRAMWKNPCCSQSLLQCPQADPNGDLQTTTACSGFSAYRVGDAPIAPINQLAFTKGLAQLRSEPGVHAQGVLNVPALRVCRPHQKKACKWGTDCNNVHICRRECTLANGVRAMPLHIVGKEESPEAAGECALHEHFEHLVEDMVMPQLEADDDLQCLLEEIRSYTSGSDKDSE